MKYIIENFSLRFTYEECIELGNWLRNHDIPLEINHMNNIIIDINEQDLIAFRLKFKL